MSPVVEIGIVAASGSAGESGAGMGEFVWTKVLDVNDDYSDVACSYNGAVVICADRGGATRKVWVSADYGDTWADAGLPAPSNRWTCVACNSDGTTLFAGGYVGRLHRSQDAGATWADVSPMGPDQQYDKVQCSDDGLTVICTVEFSPTAWLSSDGGGSWSEINPFVLSPSTMWAACCSGDGQTLLVASYRELWLSKNGGGSWTLIKPTGSASSPWMGLNASGDGVHIAATLYVSSYDSQVWMSHDGGNSWSNVTPFAEYWREVSVSDDGQTLLAGCFTGHMYRSDDGGSTWELEDPYGTFPLGSANWTDTAMADGAEVLYGQGGFDLWRKMRTSVLLFDIKACVGTDSGGTGYPFDIVGCRCE